MSEQDKNIRLEGVVHASRYGHGQGKQFLGAAIECSDGTVWVISYDEQSPFHAFAGRQVVVSGEPYEPDPRSQLLIGWRGGRTLRHCRVSNMKLPDGTPNTELIEVGAGRHISGRFVRGKSGPEKSMMSFVDNEGVTFLVVNDPAGATVGPIVQVRAYPVRPSISIPGASGQYLWIICPHSTAQLWAWRERHS
jgi:hypothetical protein